MAQEGREKYQKDKAKISPSWDRFAVGFMAALLIPLAKVYQNGIKMDEGFNGWILLGVGIPVVLMAVFVGLYAVYVEKKEYDYARLFRMCLAVPAMVTTLVGGVDIKAGVIKTAHAATNSKEIKCVKSKGLKRGLDIAYEALTNNPMGIYFVVDHSIEAKGYFLVDDVKWYIQRPTNVKERGVVLFDRYKCEIVIDVKD